MVDLLSRGRLNLGVGSGYLAHEFEGFNVSQAEKRERFDEALSIITDLWKGEALTYNGKFNQLDQIKLNVLPQQKPMPPLSVAILRKEAARFVGLKKLGIMMIPYATSENLSELKEAIESYKDGYQESTGDLVGASVTFAIHAHCDTSLEEADRVALRACELYVDSRLYAKRRPYHLLKEKNLFAAGEPERVLETIRRYEEIGVTELLLITNFGGIPRKKVLQSLQLIGKSIIPELEKDKALA